MGVEIDCVFALDEINRVEAIKKAEERARAECIKAGAVKDSIEIAEKEDIPLAYLPGNATRIKIIKLQKNF